MKISVIIPVYNTAGYLKKCLDSVTGQSFEDLEIILVDDGSADESPEICDGFRREDGRIKVLHKPNGGLSSARNAGLEAYTGDRVLFLDSDDWYLDSDCVRKLARRARETGDEVICFGYARRKSDWEEITPPPSPDKGRLGDPLYLADRKLYTSSACLKLISRKLLERENLRFEPGVLSEDIEFSGRLLLKARGVSYCPGCTYVYRQREGSITSSVTKKHRQDLLYIVKKMRGEEYAGRCPAYKSYLAFQYCTLLINAVDSGIFKEKREDIKNLSFLLDEGDNGAVRLVRLFKRLFGLKTASFALRTYYKTFLR